MRRLLPLLLPLIASVYPPVNELYINPQPLLIGQGFPEPWCQRTPMMVARETVLGNLHAFWWQFGDFDFDERITQTDIAWFDVCYSGANVPYPRIYDGKDIACWLCDGDMDGDVDMDDFGMMQRSEVRR